MLKLNQTPFLLILLSPLLPLTACHTYHADPTSPAAIGLDADLPGIQDRIFVQDALAGGAKEIEMGLLGVQRADNLDLQLLAQRIFDDHTQANRDLGLIASQEQVPLPSQAPDYSVKHLGGLSGSAFDRVYLQHMQEGHRADIKKFEAAARNARSRNIRDFAARTLPILREHLRIAQNISRNAGIGSIVNEAAGAEPRPLETSPFYQGDSERPHQFNPEK